MSWTVSNLRCLLERTFLSKKAASSQKKNHKYLGVVLSALTGRKKRRPFSISKRALAAASETAGRRRPLRPYFFTTGGSLTWTPKTQAVSFATSKKSVCAADGLLRRVYPAGCLAQLRSRCGFPRRTVCAARQRRAHHRRIAALSRHGGHRAAAQGNAPPEVGAGI